MKKNMKKILAFGGALALVGATLTGCTTGKLTPEDFTQTEGYKQAIEAATTAGAESVDITIDNEDIKNAAIASVDITLDNDNVIAQAIEQIPSDRDAEIARLNEEIARLNAVTTEATEVAEEIAKETDANGYNLDELEIGAEFNVTLTDRKLDGLFDGEVEFDDEDYDAEEVIYLTGLKISSNEEDYGTNTYLTIPVGGIKYAMTFEKSLDTKDIGHEDVGNGEETLTFNFLGEEVEVSDWDVYKITFTKGTKETIKQGMSMTVDDITITVDAIGSSTVSVSVENGGFTKKELIGVGNQEKVNGIEINVKEILDSDEPNNDFVTLEVGTDVKNTVEDGDEYEKDSPWEYVINANSIGIVLVEEYTDLDEDEDYQALDVGDKIYLPNNFGYVTYNGLTEGDVEDYRFDLNTKEGNEYVRLRGNVLSGINDYSKVYINETGIYNEDLEEIGLTVELGDTELTLDIVGDYMVIDDIKLNIGLNETFVNNVDISGHDEDYLTTYGIEIDNPEDSVDDNKFKIEIPEEQLTAEIVVKLK